VCLCYISKSIDKDPRSGGPNNSKSTKTANSIFYFVPWTKCKSLLTKHDLLGGGGGYSKDTNLLKFNTGSIFEEPGTYKANGFVFLIHLDFYGGKKWSLRSLSKYSFLTHLNKKVM
jgi:hypothetical protein